MNHDRATPVSQSGLDLLAPAPGYPRSLLAFIGDQSAPELLAVAVQQKHGVTA
jgi:hypothetical protein